MTLCFRKEMKAGTLLGVFSFSKKKKEIGVNNNINTKNYPSISDEIR
jgi:hypothetical protein